MKKYVLSLILIFGYFSFSLAQTIIYSEDFSGQNGKGAIGVLPAEDLSGVNWSINISATNFLDNTDYFIVENMIENGERDAKFIGRHLRGTAVWLSPIIDISNFTDVKFSLNAYNYAVNLEPDDSFLTEYRINNTGPWQQATVNGNITGTFVTEDVSTNSLAGNTIQLRISMNNDDINEIHALDNIIIEGTATTDPIVIITPNIIPNIINVLGYVEGENSLQESTFTIQGLNLTGEIVLTAPPNFEISTIPGVGFDNTITLNQTGGEVNVTTIYVRLENGLTASTYSGTLTATSTDITTQNIDLSGEVTLPISDCSELIISEYHERANGNENFIELYNPTDSAIDLTNNYRLARYIDGRVVLPSTLNLTGTINAYETYLVSRDGSSLCTEADLCPDSPVLNFDGNDAIALQTFDGDNIDVIGIIGNINIFAQNVALRRNADIATPTVTYDASQWAVVASNNTNDLGSHLSDCQCANSTTWTETGWDNGAPDINTVAFINANYDTNLNGGSFTTCSLIVNAVLRVSNGQFIDVVRNVIVEDSGEIIVQTQGSFIQKGVGAAAAGSFIINGNGSALVNKNTSPLNNWYDYTYWSSPVANADVDIALSSANPERRFFYNAANFEDLDGDDIDDDGNDWTLATGTGVMEIGRGYAATHTQNGFSPGLTPEYNFSGALNTGDYAFPLAYNPTNLSSWNLVGNPYPSAIDTDIFFARNTSINNVVYLWSHFTAPLNTNIGNEVLNFNQSDYLIINGTMGTGNGSDLNGDGVVDGLDMPDTKIPSGQAFFVSSTSANPIRFDNSMRLSGDNANDEFYRTANPPSNTSPTNRLWINLNSDTGVYSQTGIGYVAGATDGFDGMSYDARRNESYTNAASIYSIIDGFNDTKFAIQGKAINTLTEQEIIPLGFTTNVSEASIYTIKVLKFEGDFLNTNPIYLKDNLVGAIHNLKDADYNFTSEIGEFNNRFEIIFNNNILSVEDTIADANAVTLVELLNGDVEIKITNNFKITKVDIFDITGRHVYNLSGNSSTEVYNLSKLSKAAYIAKITLSNGQVISKKAIKQK
ncbi:lamin tail domain-containing protein [Winogradskyella sp.]|nr:lamin tail domain-containing protein [Winogradskyella sp.]